MADTLRALSVLLTLLAATHGTLCWRWPCVWCLVGYLVHIMDCEVFQVGGRPYLNRPRGAAVGTFFLVGSLFFPRNTAVQTCCDAVCVPRMSVNPSKLDSPVCTYRTRYVYTLCKAMTSGRCTWGRLSCWWNWWTWFSCACVRVPEMLSSTRCISAHINSTHTYTACTTHYARYVRVRAKAENPFVASSGVKLACDVIQGVVRWRTEWGEWTDR